MPVRCNKLRQLRRFIQTVCRKRFSKNRKIFGRSFRVNAIFVSPRAPVNFGFAFIRRSKFDGSRCRRNSNNLLIILFFIRFIVILKKIFASECFMARFVQSVIAKRVPKTKVKRKVVEVQRRNADKIYGKPEKQLQLGVYWNTMRRFRMTGEAWRISTALSGNATIETEMVFYIR